MSGPSATANPMSAKIAVSSSTTWLIGWMRPASAGASGNGKVTSMVSAARRCSRAAPLSASRRAAIAAVIRSLRPLISGPRSLRSSGDILPSVASSAEIEPFLPSAATRTASSAASSAAVSIMRVSSPSRAEMSSAAVSFIDASQTVSARRHAASSTATAEGRRFLSRGQRRSGRECGLRLVDDRLECGRFVDGEVGQHLAVDHDARLVEPGDEPAVGQSKIADRRVEALDPQGAEGALAPLAIAKGVLVRFLDCLLGDADGILAPPVITLGSLEDLFVFGVGGDAALDPGHGRSPLRSKRCDQ